LTAIRWQYEDWDGVNTTRHDIPFEFEVKMPPPLYARKILARNELGRIVRSRV